VNVPALAAYLDRAATVPARLGGFDCVRFVIEGIRVGWGEDFRGCLRYACRREAVEQLRGAGGLRANFCAVLGDPVAAAGLQPGDIAYLSDPETGTAAVGLVLPGYVAVKVGRTIARVPLDRVAEGWTWARH